LFFGEGAGTCKVVLSAIAHLDVLTDEVLVGDLGVAFYNGELLLVLAGGDGGEVAALDLCLVEPVEEGQWDVFVLLVCEIPLDPFLILYLEVLQQT
jgi:hypothetical protein